MTVKKNAVLAASLVAAASVLAFAPAADATQRARAVPAKAAPVKAKSCPELNAVDPDGDGSWTIFEAKRRALNVFAKINKDGDRTLELDELKGRMTAKEFAATQRGRDGKMSRLELLRVTKTLFRAANKDRDWSLECDEIDSPAGRALARLLK